MLYTYKTPMFTAEQSVCGKALPLITPSLKAFADGMDGLIGSRLAEELVPRGWSAKVMARQGRYT
jgi:hypothetical protein